MSHDDLLGSGCILKCTHVDLGGHALLSEVFAQTPHTETRRVDKDSSLKTRELTLALGGQNQFAHDEVDVCELCICTRWCMVEMSE